MVLLAECLSIKLVRISFLFLINHVIFFNLIFRVLSLLFLKQLFFIYLVRKLTLITKLAITSLLETVANLCLRLIFISLRCNLGFLDGCIVFVFRFITLLFIFFLADTFGLKFFAMRFDVLSYSLSLGQITSHLKECLYKTVSVKGCIVKLSLS